MEKISSFSFCTDIVFYIPISAISHTFFVNCNLQKARVSSHIDQRSRKYKNGFDTAEVFQIVDRILSSFNMW